jgi:hypothetical protein
VFGWVVEEEEEVSSISPFLEPARKKRNRKIPFRSRKRARFA